MVVVGRKEERKRLKLAKVGKRSLGRCALEAVGAEKRWRRKVHAVVKFSGERTRSERGRK